MNKFSKALEKLAKDKKNAKKMVSAEGMSKDKEFSHNTEEIDILQRSTPAVKTVVDAHQVNPSIVALHDPRSRISEQYRVLRTNLKSIRKKAIKTILVTSSIEGEGKTVTSLNLAFTLAQDKTKKVLLIDADMRRSRVAFYLGMKKRYAGLRDVLHKQATFDEALIYTGYENLQILVNKEDGKVDNAAELLDSQEMKKIMAFVRDEYDYVIIDSPPVIPVTDAAILGSHVDGVLLAFKAEKTQRNTLKHARMLLEQAHANILGYVMTNVRYISPGYRDYYYYSYN